MRSRDPSPRIRLSHAAWLLLPVLAACGGGGSAGGPAQQADPTPIADVPASPQPAPAAGPLVVGSANPRYFVDPSGRPVYLTGSHTWFNFQDGDDSYPPAAFDYLRYLDFLESHHHNFFRLWQWEHAYMTYQDDGGRVWHNPMPFERTGPGLALDGERKFDLTRLDQAYFDRLRARVMEAGSRGIYVSIMLFNGWSVMAHKNGGPFDAWIGHPFNAANNINGVNGDLNDNGSGEELHELASPTLTAMQEAYVRKIVDTVNDLDNVLYEISNESEPTSVQWQYHMINFVKDYEATSKTRRHPVGMTVVYPGGSNSVLLASPADWISPNGDLGAPEAASGQKVVIADTDHLCGTCGERAWVWKSLTRGQNPIFMDPYDAGSAIISLADPNDPAWVDVRRSLGHARDLTARLDLGRMVPRGDLASSGYCLADETGAAPAFVVYSESGGQFSLDVSAVSGSLTVEWLRPADGALLDGGTIGGGAVRTLTVPFAGDAVVYLHR